MKRIRTAVAAAVLVLSAAAVAPAQEVDAETRFHRAYEREVVDGKVADAAREYLAMMGDEKVPERLRQEAKFRFAVTAMLLGRADEARVRFGELAADAKAPESLRARATEYLDAAKGVGVGNETDKKMQSLVFDLARDTVPTAAVYREFEVIGKPAVPFLRKLLQHEDAALRGHAFIVLCRMGTPGMVDLWSPSVTADSYALSAFLSYVAGRPDDRAAFEEKLLALDDETLRTTMQRQDLRVAYSAEALRAFAARKVAPHVVIARVLTWTEETDRVRGEWIAGDDVKFSEQATLSYLTYVKTLPPENVALRTDLFPAIVARLETMPLASLPMSAVSGTMVPTSALVTDALARIASAIPAEQVLDTLEKAVERGAAAPAGDANPLRSGLVHAIARAVEQRDPQAELPARYGEIVKRWGAEASKQGLVPQDFPMHVSAAVYRMPEEAATALATWAATTPLAGWKTSAVVSYLPGHRARDVPVVMAAMRAGDAETRGVLIGRLEAATTEPLRPEFADAYLSVVPELVRIWTRDFPGQHLNSVIAEFVGFAEALPADAAREHFVAAALAVAENPNPGIRQQALTSHLMGFSVAGRTAYWADVAVPALDRVWPKLYESDRVQLFKAVLGLLDKAPRDDALRAAIGRFTKARYGEVPSHATQHLANAPDVFPLTEWVPKVSAVDNQAAVPNERADPAVREMTADVESVNASVLRFTALSASPEVQRDVIDRMLRTGPIERMDVVSLNARLASPDAIEEGIRRMVAEKAPDSAALARLVVRLRTVRPSEALFPAVRVLLRSNDVTVGIETAKLLGREELLPDLAGLLDSMDAAVRTAAKEAIDSIVELRKLKDEARRGAGGK